MARLPGTLLACPKPVRRSNSSVCAATALLLRCYWLIRCLRCHASGCRAWQTRSHGHHSPQANKPMLLLAAREARSAAACCDRFCCNPTRRHNHNINAGFPRWLSTSPSLLFSLGRTRSLEIRALISPCSFHCAKTTHFHCGLKHVVSRRCFPFRREKSADTRSDLGVLMAVSTAHALLANPCSYAVLHSCTMRMLCPCPSHVPGAAEGC